MKISFVKLRRPGHRWVWLTAIMLVMTGMGCDYTTAPARMAGAFTVVPPGGGILPIVSVREPGVIHTLYSDSITFRIAELFDLREK